jgi:hypothetical protein
MHKQSYGAGMDILGSHYRGQGGSVFRAIRLYFNYRRTGMSAIRRVGLSQKVGNLLVLKDLAVYGG